MELRPGGAPVPRLLAGRGWVWGRCRWCVELFVPRRRLWLGEVGGVCGVDWVVCALWRCAGLGWGCDGPAAAARIGQRLTT